MKVLFVCIHNSARSQMAEAFANQLGRGACRAESAGLEPGRMNPLVVEVMKEIGIDLTGKPTRGVRELAERSERFDFVITVCDEATERCPVFPGAAERLAWTFPDPSSFRGTHEEQLDQTRRVRDAIRRAVEELCERHCRVPPG